MFQRLPLPLPPIKHLYGCARLLKWALSLGVVLEGARDDKVPCHLKTIALP